MFIIRKSQGQAKILARVKREREGVCVHSRRESVCVSIVLLLSPLVLSIVVLGKRKLQNSYDFKLIRLAGRHQRIGYCIFHVTFGKFEIHFLLVKAERSKNDYDCNGRYKSVMATTHFSIFVKALQRPPPTATNEML